MASTLMVAANDCSPRRSCCSSHLVLAPKADRQEAATLRKLRSVRYLQGMRELFYLGALVVSACSQNKGEQSDCPSSGDFHYEGVVLVTEAGDSSFALATDCAFFVSGPEIYYESVRAAWIMSPYRDDNRPIFLSATGKVEAREDLAPVFRIRSVREVSLDFTRLEARDQFRLRMDREPES